MSYDDPLKFIRDLRRQLNPIGDLTDALKSQLGVITDFSQGVRALSEIGAGISFANQFNAASQLAAAHDFSCLNDMIRSSQLLPIMEASGVNQLHAELEVWKGISALASSAVIAERLGGWSIGIQTVLQAPIPLPTVLSMQLLRPASMFTGLSANTAQRLGHISDPKKRERLEQSLCIIEEQVATHVADLGIIASTVASSVESDGNEIIEHRITLATREQTEMLALPASHALELGELQAIPAAEIHSLSRDVLLLVNNINRTARTLSGTVDIFKLTNRVFQVAVELPWLDAENEGSFGDFNDALYFLLYEGAGKDKLRFLREHGGVLDQSSCDIIFHIKHLRNKWLRHDPEHGDSISIRKSYVQVKECLKLLGFTHPPQNASDYRALQRRILRDVVTFLQRLLAGLE